jgi:uncharacterized protein (TIGR04255 family)
MAKLANAPVYYTIGQVRHNPLLSLETYIPTIQEAMRKSGYPDYRVSKLTTLVWAGSPTESSPTPPTSQQNSRYTFSNSDRTRAFILFPNSISFETTRYDTSKSFFAEMMKGLSLINDIVGGFSFIDRIGLRYVDAVIPDTGESVRAYVNEQFHGLAARMPDASLAYSFSESRLVSEGVGAVVARVLFQRSRLAVPPDLQIELNIDNRFAGVDGDHAILDTDGSWEMREEFDLAEIEARFKQVHTLMKRTFESIASPHALQRWA